VKDVGLSATKDVKPKSLFDSTATGKPVEMGLFSKPKEGQDVFLQLNKE
jgi:hypothetical protein